MQISNTALAISQNKEFISLRKLLKQHTKRAYFVGGYVRDTLQSLQSCDFDIEIYDISPEKFDTLMQSIGAKGVGKSYFVYKFGNFDLSLPRTESKNGIGHKAFNVEYCNDELLASKRRDFTINSMMINIFSGEVLDFWGGRADLKNRILRIVDEKSFSEDSLRVLRAVQFVARFGLKVDPKSLEIMQNIDINDLSKERIRLELEKLFAAKNQDLGINLLSDLGLDIKLFGAKFEPKFARLVKEHFKITKDNRTFLYDLINLYNLKNLPEIFSLSKEYKSVLNEPFFTKISKFDMLKVALNLPLCKWLGLNTKNRINLAKRLGFYETKFEPNVDIKSILSAGFSGENIKKEISRRQNLAIKNYLKDLK
ncbi:multifunctional tRNA nucleotidyl transferase / 2'3'-cyclic phosphodiesterase / 2' nucleotidase/phosphatase [Campylobacter iguaniorum]|uniref:Multifunctional tRNA nucleotidyl transferase / 2'3'-cyclic phosphodiesterase / 2' nucleotidase/phosphatase n=1 Tax=Campylobacter iguaniorum TaxID=1244531 RepID=A0A076FAP2_9BACT|nr:CCA tRNA nucleotidyltransferase [Campylobacter iguaniorum]AII14758.2 multifunctional tRNA nucleotidyl transferase / 2'3'-cyclic phosphodiesterase / 2' nucleotidase/phosphatase [Campylobacter iguaniorum]